MKRWKKWLVASLVALGVVSIPVAGYCLNVTWELFLLLLMWIAEGGNPLDVVLGAVLNSGMV